MSDVARLRVAADYECHAVWQRRADGGLDNLAPEDLGLSDYLGQALARWAAIFDLTLNSLDPMESGFATGLEHELFVEWGRMLASALACEMGESVEYFDDLAQEAVVLDVEG
jgi:hypothetical protein